MKRIFACHMAESFRMEVRLKTKRICAAVVLAVMFALAGCGAQSTVKIVEEEKTYPEPDTVVSSLEGAGFEVEKSENFDEIGVNATRIKAVSGEEYLDVCYNVSSADDMDKIVEYYTGSYKKYNLVSDDEVVYCYSSEAVIESAGLE